MYVIKIIDAFIKREVQAKGRVSVTRSCLRTATGGRPQPRKAEILPLVRRKTMLKDTCMIHKSPKIAATSL